MSSEDFAIRIRDLGKCYQIYERPQDRLKQSIVPRLDRLFGRTARDYYREFWALRDINLEIKRGETVGIIGKNGSGKSTLLQIICGTLTPTEGEVRIDGRVAALLELGSGFNPEFTGRENVYLNASVLGLSRHSIDARFDSIVRFADIGDFIDQPVKMYSSGMYVRLAFAVIAHVDADILIIDEALAVGDAFFTQKCMRFLRDFMAQGTVVFVSHDSAAVQNLCSRAALLQEGKLQFVGTAKEATERYLEALYQSVQDVAGSDETHGKTYPEPVAEEEYKDMRSEFVNASSLRNDIEIFRFDPDADSFGTGRARIVSVVLRNAAGEPLSWVVGGEDVNITVTCIANERIERPIIGFTIKDRLGQPLFGDNTFLLNQRKPTRLNPGQRFSGSFDFRLPVLAVGDYSIDVAIAEGTQENHVQHHRIHDGLIFRSHASSTCFGLFSVPMRAMRVIVHD